MALLRFTLLGESTSDDALVRIIELTLEQPALGLLPDVDIVSEFASPHRFHRSFTLRDRMVATASDFPCDLLFVHRDADGPGPESRANDIRATAALEQHRLPPVVPVVPVREMEAWLLLDESAICRAAGAARPAHALGLPRVHEVEACPDPKLALKQALAHVHGGSARHRRSTDEIQPRDVVAHLNNIAPLRQLPAFQAFETAVREVIDRQRWPARLPG